MGEKRSWWKQIKRPSVIGIIAVSVLLVALIVVEVRFYGTGFAGKTLWDWLGLLGVLAIPVVVGFGVAWFTAQQAKVSDAANERQHETELQIATDNQREAALQAYIDKISELLLKEHLGERAADGKLKPEYEQVRNVARVRTITVLTQLDARRIGYVFTFLNEAKLMSPTFNNNAVSLGGADFHSINWTQANLSQAHLTIANLSQAHLYHADLSNANLSGAIGTTPEQLAKAKFLQGATMPDGSIHP
jgi:hypothetical protein